MGRILVTGGSGMLGKSLQKVIPQAIYVTSRDYDLISPTATNKMLRDIRPTSIIHLAAKAGGIIDNVNKPCQYLEDNLLINTNLIKSARENKIKDLLAISSTCIYPTYSSSISYPLKEDMIFEGRPEPTNEGYAYSKRAMIMHLQTTNKQYGTNYRHIIPCNLYGLTDNFTNINKAHFITALLMKIHEAEKYEKKEILLYGSGTPIRQFIFSEDLAQIIGQLIDKGIQNIPENGLNVATDESYTINEMATLALKTLSIDNYKINYDRKHPDGQYRKDVCNNKIKKLLPNLTFTSLKEGMKKVYSLIKNEDLTPHFNDKIS